MVEKIFKKKVNMGIHYNKSNIHWNYFLAIEQDFELLSRYIEFTESNNNTFSIELARIIMVSTQEVDVILKKLCKLVEPESTADNINQYKPIILNHFPEFTKETVQIQRFGMTSKPWINWFDSNDHPFWWTANNKIKHQRTEHFEKANLKNAYNSLGGLLVATLYYYKTEIEKETGNPLSWTDLTFKLKPNSSLLKLRDEYYIEPGTWAEAQW